MYWSRPGSTSHQAQEAAKRFHVIELKNILQYEITQALEFNTLESGILFNAVTIEKGRAIVSTPHALSYLHLPGKKSRFSFLTLLSLFINYFFFPVSHLKISSEICLLLFVPLIRQVSPSIANIRRNPQRFVPIIDRPFVNHAIEDLKTFAYFNACRPLKVSLLSQCSHRKSP
jgi:hypothetical protein